VSPWSVVGSVLGWIALSLLVLIGLGLALTIIGRVSLSVRRYVRYRRTRKTPPAAGQRWWQGTGTITVKYIAPNGRIVLESASGVASWSDSPEEWAERVKHRRAFLVQERP
jgi:hypothetical protein